MVHWRSRIRRQPWPIERRYSRHANLAAFPNHPRVEPLEQRRRGMKSLGELLFDRLIPERGKRCLIDELWRNALLERPFHIVAGDGVGLNRGLGSLRERFPRRAIRSAAGGQALRRLQRRERVRKRGAGLAVNLSRRKPLPVQQDLEADEIAAGECRRLRWTLLA